MEKMLNADETETIVNKYKRILKLDTRNGKKPVPSQYLSKEQWISFAELVSDLELNDQGIKILYQEVYSGRVLLPCDRAKKMPR